MFRIVGDNKYWAQSVSREYGNYDYLMFSDIDHNHPEVFLSISLLTGRLELRSRNGRSGLLIPSISLGYDLMR